MLRNEIYFFYLVVAVLVLFSCKSKLYTDADANMTLEDNDCTEATFATEYGKLLK